MVSASVYVIDYEMKRLSRVGSNPGWNSSSMKEWYVECLDVKTEGRDAGGRPPRGLGLPLVLKKYII